MLQEFLRDPRAIMRRPTQHRIIITAGRTVEEQMEGYFNTPDPNINSENFPPPESDGEVMVELLSMGEACPTHIVREYAESVGKRPLTPQELLALGEQWPLLQFGQPLAALGGSYNDGAPLSPEVFVYLDHQGKQRTLLTKCPGYWPEWYQFPVTAK